jgi:hypothetical protein
MSVLLLMLFKWSDTAEQSADRSFLYARLLKTCCVLVGVPCRDGTRVQRFVVAEWEQSP